MMRKTFFHSLIFLVSIFSISQLHSAPPKDLAYPQGKITANEIINQVYFVNHFYSVNNISFERDAKGHVTTMILRSKGEKPSVIAFRRYLNNAYADGDIKARDLALFGSGNLKGVRILLTEYNDPDKRKTYKMWLPSLKKIQGFSEPEHDAAWRDSDFTYGDIYLRNPEDEKHEILGEQNFEDCLGAMVFNLEALSNTRLIKNIPSQQCDHRGKAVYRVKSSTKFKNWWYDYRVSYVDQSSFADYRIDFFKDGVLVKRIDKDWVPMSDKVMNLAQDDRAIFWRYWYGKNYQTGHETMIHTWPEVVRWNHELKDELWTEQSLTGN